MEPLPNRVRSVTVFEKQQLAQYEVCIIGCGALGGYVAPMLARLGVGYMTLIDGNGHKAAQLDRDPVATQNTMGQNKAVSLGKLISASSPDLLLRILPYNVLDENANTLLKNHDLILDCTNDPAVRTFLDKGVNTAPVVVGMVNALRCTVASVMPGDGWMRMIETLSNVSAAPPTAFSVAAAASIMANEAFKWLTRRDEALQPGRVLTLDLDTYALSIADLPLG